MTNRPPAMTGEENYRRGQISKAMKRQAEHRRCPECKRGAGLSKPFLVDGFYYQRCRYCGYEKGATEYS